MSGRRTSSLRTRIATLFLVAATAAAAAAQREGGRQSIGSASAPRGAIGEIVFEYAGAALCARADQAETAPMLVRLTRLEEPATASGAVRYRLTFLGAVSGEYDLLPLIEHCDGRPVMDLEPIRVQVFTQLPERHGTDLFADERPLPSLAGRYRLLMGAVVAIWILVPLAVLLRRRLNRRPAPAPEPQVPEPTLADQLRPLVEKALDRGLSIAEQGRLELMLLRFWQVRLGFEHLEPAEGIARMRRAPEAARLLVAVEEWLHAERTSSPRPRPDVALLLEPYRSAPALSEDALRQQGRGALAEAAP